MEARAAHDDEETVELDDLVSSIHRRYQLTLFHFGRQSRKSSRASVVRNDIKLRQADLVLQSRTSRRAQYDDCKCLCRNEGEFKWPSEAGPGDKVLLLRYDGSKVRDARPPR